jgi:hypothetical protein
MTNDMDSDQDLIDAALADPEKKLLIVDAAGNPVANRFTPPPDWKHSTAKFQDRTFYGADVLDGVDEVETAAGSTTICRYQQGVGASIRSNQSTRPQLSRFTRL